MSCGVSNYNHTASDSETEVKETQPNLSWFYIFTIHRDNSSPTNIVELVSKKEIAGKMKTESTHRSVNYLTVYLYSGKQLVDTLSMDHPLYKHYEYVGENGAFKYKDTLINNSDFVLRTQRDINEIKIFETLKNQAKKQLIIKSF